MIKLVSADITTSNGASFSALEDPGFYEVAISGAVVNAPPGSVILSGGYDLSSTSWYDPPAVSTSGPVSGTGSWSVSVHQASAFISPAPTPADHVFGTVYAIVEVFETY